MFPGSARHRRSYGNITVSVPGAVPPRLGCNQRPVGLHGRHGTTNILEETGAGALRTFLSSTVSVGAFRLFLFTRLLGPRVSS